MQSNLDKNQKEAVSLGLGPAMILAGPGSGKTTVILERIKYLSYELNISLQKILVITYTKAAAIEMKTRAEKILNLSKESPIFGTFHSYFYSVLKRSYRYQNYSLITGKQKLQIMEQILRLYFPKMRISNNFMLECYSCISKQKNDIDIYADLVKIGFTKEQFDILKKKTEEAFDEQKLFDYDDILLFSFKLLKENPYILEKIRQETAHILVDEFQDVNSIQYELITLLAGKNGNLYVVGDDDQSIYRFRGAGEENLRRFETEFLRVKRVVLNMNYRCPISIVNLSSKLISHNQKRFTKELCSGTNTEGKVNCCQFLHKNEERKFIVSKIKDIVQFNKAGIEKRKTAVLCRTNSQLGYFAELLKKEDIKFYRKEAGMSFYVLPHIKPIIGYFMFATNVDRSRKRLLTFLNRPLRGISREILADWGGTWQELLTRERMTEGERKEFQKLDAILKTIRQLSPEMAVTYISKVVGYESYVKEYCASMEEVILFQESLEELRERAKMYSSLREWMELVQWEENSDVGKQSGNMEDVIDEAEVFLYTFHGAKGLEFDTVFIPHLNEGSVPYGKNLTQEELEEERRMFYVALTRCSDELWITLVENDTKKDTASRFLKECELTASKVH